GIEGDSCAVRKQAALDGRAGVRGDRGARHDGADELRAGADRGRAADLPEDVARGCAAGHLDLRCRSDRERARGLEDPDRVGRAGEGEEAAAVERELAALVDAWREREA